MSLQMTRRAVFRKLAESGIATLAAGLTLVGCDSESAPQPKSPPTDPNTTGKGAKDLRKYICGKCGYVHDPAASDPQKPFADLPTDWKCPRCGSPKSRFAPKE